MNEIITTKELANILDLTPRRVQQYVKDGILSNEGRGKFNLKKSIHEYFNYKIGLQKENQNKKGGDYYKSLARKTELEAELKEIELAKRKNEIIEIEDVEELFTEIITIAKTKIMRRSATLAPKVAIESDVVKVKKIIDENSRVILNELKAAGNI